MNGVRRALVFLAILVASISCDHAAKHVARDALAAEPPISLARDVVRLELVANPGAFLSLGAQLPEEVRRIAFLVLVPILLLVVCTILLRQRGLAFHQLVGVALVAGGGLANWLDRLAHAGAVTDFVSLGFGPVRTGIFNLADVAIIAGVILAAWARRPPPRDLPDPEVAG